METREVMTKGPLPITESLIMKNTQEMETTNDGAIIWNSGRGFEKASRRKSWCDSTTPCRFCKDYVLGGTLRQACVMRPKDLKKPRKGKKKREEEAAGLLHEALVLGSSVLTFKKPELNIIQVTMPQGITNSSSQSKKRSHEMANNDFPVFFGSFPLSPHDSSKSSPSSSPTRIANSESPFPSRVVFGLRNEKKENSYSSTSTSSSKPAYFTSVMHFPINPPFGRNSSFLHSTPSAQTHSLSLRPSEETEKPIPAFFASLRPNASFSIQSKPKMMPPTMNSSLPKENLEPPSKIPRLPSARKLIETVSNDLEQAKESLMLLGMAVEMELKG